MSINYQTFHCEELRKQANELFEEYCQTPKFHFIKRRALKLAYDKIYKLWYENLKILEKLTALE